MKLSDIKNIEYMFEEYRIPLFVTTDKNHFIFKDDILGFYKNNRLRVYYINKRPQIEIRTGYRYFSKANAVEKYNQHSERVIRALNSLVEKYKDLNFRELPKEELHDSLNEFIKIFNMYSNVYAKTEAVNLRKFESTKNKTLIKKLDQIGKIRFKLRKSAEAIFYIFFGKILQEVARRFKLKFDDLIFYTYKELMNLFKGKKISNRILLARKKGYLIWKMNKKIKILTGREFKEMWKWIKFEFIELEGDVLKGKVANKGRTKGRVRVIIHTKRKMAEEIAKFKKGEILVTEMTRPDTVLACKRARAIITDEGGVTCHAAIISREFKIPCIIATKIATKVLKNGDKIEVDANEGIIKIIKKAK